jgi:hypothetical protein
MPGWRFKNDPVKDRNLLVREAGKSLLVAFQYLFTPLRCRLHAQAFGKNLRDYCAQIYFSSAGNSLRFRQRIGRQRQSGPPLL